MPAEASLPSRVRSPAAALPQGRFERLPKWLNLVPMVLQWTWLGLRYGSIALPSAANPGITSGGLVGEGKLEYFAAMGALARAATADYLGVANAPGLEAAAIVQRMHAQGLGFPIVAKPDIGWCGHGVRLLAGEAELAAYLRAYPPGETFLLQRYLPEPGEAGLFYMRDPEAVQGRLIGILLRDYPAVTGNGRDSIAQLIAADPRLRRATDNARHECRYDPGRIPPAGEVVRLSTVASTRVGGCYRDGSALATPALLARVEAIARDMGQFLVGRFDVRYSDLEALRRGEFTIMEVNGAGSEAVHAWDPKYSIREVYRIVFAKQRLLFAIADASRRRGARPISLRELARLWLRQRRIMRAYPPSN
jgi:hypothetical protein